MSTDQPEPISLATVLVEPFFNEQDLRVAGTGVVIVSPLVGPFLVTARHVVSGRHPDGHCLHSQGAIPSSVRLTNYFGPLAAGVHLYRDGNDPSSDSPIFLCHPNKNVDVALLPLPHDVMRFEVNHLHSSLWRPDTFARSIPVLYVAETCHIVGYPEGLMNRVGKDRVLPLWKTGHLASDPEFPFTNHDLKFENEPLCLIDATTRPGLSGAPVFVVHETGHEAVWPKEVSFAEARQGPVQPLRPASSPPFERRTRLVGIYSGRTSDSSDIGIVWRTEVIHEILSAHVENW